MEVNILSNRGLKNRKAISTSVENELYKAFVELSKELRIVKSILLDEAIEGLLAKHGKKIKRAGGTQ